MGPMEYGIHSVQTDADSRSASFRYGRRKIPEQRFDLRPTNIRPHRVVEYLLKRAVMFTVHGKLVS
jgi:hypothetical protein